MKDSAQVVIVGGGIAGASIAWHLARLGCRDVLVLDQGPLVSGTTSHAPGLVGQLRSSVSLTRMLVYSVDLYRNLSLDGEPGYLGEGSLRLASSPARLAQIRQQADHARAVGLEAHLITPAEAGRLFPLMSLDGIEGALFLPTDGSAVAPVLARALIQGAGAEGVTFQPHTRVTGIEVTGGQVRGLTVTGAIAGRIETETLVVAAGIWSPLLARLAGVTLPLTPMQHQYAVTTTLPELVGQTVPNLRDPDRLVYLRQLGDGLALGGYERTPRVWDVDTIPDRPDPTVQTFDVDHFDPLLRALQSRVPALTGVGFTRQVNGLESFTPDGEFLLGPSPEVAGFWAACGFCAHGVSGAGGVGKVMAEWIVNGDPGLDMTAQDLRRFQGWSGDKRAVQEAARRVYATYYDLQP